MRDPRNPGLSRLRGNAPGAPDDYDEPRQVLLHLADELQDGTTQDEVELHIAQARDAGTPPRQVMEQGLKSAEQQAMVNSAGREAAAKKLADANERAAALTDNVTTTQRIAGFIADAFGQLSGNSKPGAILTQLQQQREGRRARAEKSAQGAYGVEIAGIEGRQADEDRARAESDRAKGLNAEKFLADAIRARLQGVFPDDAEPKSVITYYEKIAGPEAVAKAKAEAAETARQQQRTERNEDRAFDRSERAKDRAADLEARTEATRETARINREATGEQDRAKQAREIESFAQEIEANIDLLDQQIGGPDGTGTFEMFGSADADMERRLNNIAVGLAKLADPGSVAREGEVSLARKGLFTPGLGVRNETARQVLQNLKAELAGRRERAYAVRGITPPAGRTPPPAGGQGTPPPQGGGQRRQATQADVDRIAAQLGTDDPDAIDRALEAEGLD